VESSLGRPNQTSRAVLWVARGLYGLAAFFMLFDSAGKFFIAPGVADPNSAHFDLRRRPYDRLFGGRVRLQSARRLQRFRNAFSYNLRRNRLGPGLSARSTTACARPDSEDMKAYRYMPGMEA
jgi:hypothetical protein